MGGSYFGGSVRRHGTICFTVRDRERLGMVGMKVTFFLSLFLFSSFPALVIDPPFPVFILSFLRFVHSFFSFSFSFSFLAFATLLWAGWTRTTSEHSLSLTTAGLSHGVSTTGREARWTRSVGSSWRCSYYCREIPLRIQRLAAAEWCSALGERRW